jgi:hypothetical protein
MAESLFSLLSNRNFDEPAEVKAIKAYVQRYYESEVKVTVQPHAIVVAGRSAALIGSLRANLPKLQAASGTDKRILLRVG